MTKEELSFYFFCVGILGFILGHYISIGKAKKMLKAERTINQRERKELQADFEERLRMIQFEHMKNGIVRPNNGNPVLVVPVLGPERTLYQTFETEIKKINKINVSYFETSSGFSDYLKQSAASEIGRKLVDEGFLQANFDGNNIVFSVNTF